MMGRKSFPGGAVLAPVPPVLVTVSDGDATNVLTVGWCGILATTPPKTYVSIRPSRYSYEILKRGGAFVINLATASMAREVDYIGIYTGKKVDKFKKCNLTLTKSEHVTPPTIGECPIAIECRVTDILPMGTHDVFIADIVSVSCDDSILDEDGKIRFDKAGLLAYAHGEYYALGEKVGKFGFSTKKQTEKKSTQNKPAHSKPIQNNQKTENKPKAIPTAKADEPTENKKRPFYLDAPRGKSNKFKGKGKKK